MGDASAVGSPLKCRLTMSSPFLAASQSFEKGLVSRTVSSLRRGRSPSDSGEPHTGQVTRHAPAFHDDALSVCRQMLVPTRAAELARSARANQRRELGRQRRVRHLEDGTGIASEFFDDPRDLAEAEPAIKAAQILRFQAQRGREHRLRDPVEGHVTTKPRRKELVSRRLQNDGERPVSDNEARRHWKAASSSLRGLHFSTASSVSRSAPVSIASIATSFRRRNIFEVTPPDTRRMRLRPPAVRTLGWRKGKLRMMARTSCWKSSFAFQRGNVMTSKRLAS